MGWLVVLCFVAAWLAPLRAASADPGAVAAAAPAWVAPLPGPLVVRRTFDPPSVRWGAGHRGVDLAAWPGAVVRAAGAGRVTFAGALAGRGVVAVTHGAVRTTYEPVRPVVAAGTVVAAGDAVALLVAGHARAAPGEAVLHWGLLRGETYLDPLALLPRGPSRLLPVSPAALDPAPPGVPAAPPPRPAAPAALVPAGPAGSAAVPPRPAADRAAPSLVGEHPRRPRAPDLPAPLAGAAVAGLVGALVVSRGARGSP